MKFPQAWLQNAANNIKLRYQLHTIYDEFERIYSRGLMDLGYGSNVLSNEWFLAGKNVIPFSKSGYE